MSDAVPCPSVPPDPALLAVRAALRATPYSVADWLRLRALLPPGAPLDAAAVTQRAFDLRAAQLLAEAPTDSSADRLRRRSGLQPLRLQLADDLLAAGHRSMAAYHVRKLHRHHATVPLPEDLTPYPHAARWLRDPRHAAVFYDSAPETALVDRLLLRAARLLADEPLAEWPALLVYHYDGKARLLLPPAAAEGRRRLVTASTGVFASLLGQPAGTPVQVRVGCATLGPIPEVFGVALRTAPPWDGLPWEPAVVWLVDEAPGVKFYTQEPLEPYALLVLRGGRRVKTLLAHFQREGLPVPAPGDALRVRCLPSDVAPKSGVVAVEPAPVPDPQVWRAFCAPLYLTGGHGIADGDIIVFAAQLAEADAWRNGQLVDGIATRCYDLDGGQLAWRAICVRAVSA